MKAVTFIIFKLIILTILFDAYGEYVISRPVPHFIQVLATFILVIVMAITFKSIHKTIINLKNKKQ